MATITVTFTREITDEEINSMIFGTGALSWEWWKGADHRETESVWRITHWADGTEGEEIKYTDLTAEKIAEAFSELVKLEYIDPEQSDARDAILEDLGFLDAEQGDMVLQQAIFSEIVYG